MSVSQRIPVSKAIEIIQIEGGLKLSSGSNSFRALCPFHKEKTASFTLGKQNALWHCFGCGETGDVIRFVEKISGIQDFQELLKYLDSKYDTGLFEETSGNKKEKGYDFHTINRYAGTYYHETLLSLLRAESAHPVANYIRQRGISHESIERYQLGYGGDSRKHLLDHLSKNSELFDRQGFLESGLFYEYGDSRQLFDRFYKRLIFPIRKGGKVLSFSGRAFSNRDDPKYINGRTNSVFQKSHCLYGWDEAREAASEAKHVIAVEGYLDVISLSQAGFRNTVALMGVHLDPKQINIIRPVTNKILFFLDNDDAGFEALEERVLPNAINEELQCRVVYLSDDIRSKLAKPDPDELCQKFSPEIASKVIKSSLCRVEVFLWDRLVKTSAECSTNIQEERFKNRAIATFAGVFRMGANPARQASIIDFLSQKIRVNPNVISMYFVDDTKYTALRAMTSRYGQDETTKALSTESA